MRGRGKYGGGGGVFCDSEFHGLYPRREGGVCGTLLVRKAMKRCGGGFTFAHELGCAVINIK